MVSSRRRDVSVITLVFISAANLLPTPPASTIFYAFDFNRYAATTFLRKFYVRFVQLLGGSPPCSYSGWPTGDDYVLTLDAILDPSSIFAKSFLT